jgi:hypothetical protein
MSEINWADQSEVGARLVEQFGVTVAQLIAGYTDAEYDAFTTDYREGRITLGLKRDGLEVLEAAPVAPPADN